MADLPDLTGYTRVLWCHPSGTATGAPQSGTSGPNIDNSGITDPNPDAVTSYYSYDGALTQAADGDAIIIKDGSYTPTNNDFVKSGVAFIGENVRGATINTGTKFATLIDASKTLLKNLVFSTVSGTNWWINRSTTGNLDAEDCTFNLTVNLAGDRGIFRLLNGTHTRCIYRTNTSGGGGLLYGAVTTNFKHCSIIHNGVYAVGGTQNYEVCAVVNDGTSSFSGNQTFSLISGFTSGNTGTDPLFADPDNGNLELLPNSPALASGAGDTLDLSEVTGNIYWVQATGGSGTVTTTYAVNGNTKPGGTLGTFAAALAAAISGDVIVFTDGTYTWATGAVNLVAGVSYIGENLKGATLTKSSGNFSVPVGTVEFHRLKHTYTAANCFTGASSTTSFVISRDNDWNITDSGNPYYLVDLDSTRDIFLISRTGSFGTGFGFQSRVSYNFCSLVMVSSTASSFSSVFGTCTGSIKNCIIDNATGKTLSLSLGSVSISDSFVSNYSDRDDGDPLFADPANGNFELLPNSPALAAPETGVLGYVNFATGNDGNSGLTPALPKATVAAAEGISGVEKIIFQDTQSGTTTLAGNGVIYDFSQAPAQTASGASLSILGGCTVRGYKYKAVTTGILATLTAANDVSKVYLEDWGLDFYGLASDVRYINTTGVAATSLLGLEVKGFKARLGMASGAFFSNAIYGGTIPCTVTNSCFVGRGNTAPGQGNILFYTSPNAPIYFNRCIFKKGGANSMNLYGSTYDRALECIAVDDVAAIPSNFTTLALADPLFADPDNGNFELLPNSPALA